MNPPAANTIARWWKFNLVGAMGMGFQLTTLALCNHLTRGRYLYASAIAVELTLLHNFVWHLRYTWPERSDKTHALGQLIRFHLSNGLVSLTGNLILMRVLVQTTHLPVVLANGIAILCCSIVNFFLGNRWVFARAGLQLPSNGAVAPCAHANSAHASCAHAVHTPPAHSPSASQTPGRTPFPAAASTSNYSASPAAFSA